MIDFLNAIKADLLDRRLMLAVVCVAFVAAVGYAARGGGSSSGASTAGATHAPAGLVGLTLSPLNNEGAVAETTDGSTLQRGGAARDPFTPLPEPASTKSTTATSAPSASSGSSSSGAAGVSGSGAASSGSSESSSPSSGAPAPSAPAPAAPAPKPAQAKPAYEVALLFGEVPAGQSESSTLTPFEERALKAPLPTAKAPLLRYKGVVDGGKAAAFTLVSEPILRGAGACMPSPSQCKAFSLAPGQTEQLEYVSASGQITVYELRVLNIALAKGAAGHAKGALRGSLAAAGRSR